jgi:predicted CopG family antitoxin
MFGSNKQYKQILMDTENYQFFKEMGQTDDSFNQVISRLISKFKEGEE